jgi:hypothetical protein
MNSRKIVSLFLLSVLVGVGSCASDGGSSGTGITTAQGNVASVQSASLLPERRLHSTWLARALDLFKPEGSAHALGGLGDITVSIESTGISTSTDSNGDFALIGDFGGPVQIIFERANDNLAARLVIDVPNGGTITLKNIQIDAPMGQASAESARVDFEGVLSGSDCSNATATVVSSRTPNDGNVYAVHFGAASIHDDGGRPVGCPSLRRGQSLRVSGQVQDDGSFDADQIEVRGSQ